MDVGGTSTTFPEIGRRSDVRHIEEFILFDVLYEDGSRTSNRKVPGSELGGIDGDLPAKTYAFSQTELRKSGPCGAV